MELWGLPTSNGFFWAHLVVQVVFFSLRKKRPLAPKGSWKSCRSGGVTSAEKLEASGKGPCNQEKRSPLLSKGFLGSIV